MLAPVLMERGATRVFANVARSMGPRRAIAPLGSHAVWRRDFWPSTVRRTPVPETASTDSRRFLLHRRDVTSRAVPGGTRSLGTAAGASSGSGSGSGSGRSRSSAFFERVANDLIWVAMGYIVVSFTFRRQNPLTGENEFQMTFAGAADRAFNATQQVDWKKMASISVDGGPNPSLQRVADRLRAHVPYPVTDVPPLDLYIIRDTRSALELTGPFVVAAAVGERCIVFSAEMIRMLGSNETMVAGVVAHEVAHSLCRHARQKWQYTVMIQNSWMYRTFHALSTGTAIGEWLARFPDLREMVGDDLLASLAVKVSWNCEFEADMLGMKLMARAGYDPRALPAALMRISPEPRKLSPSHPSTAERVRRLKEAMPEALEIFKESQQHLRRQ